MKLADIEAQLDTFTPEQLRQLALLSWAAFARKTSTMSHPDQCSEEDPELLEALDQALAAADASLEQGCTADQVRARLGQWISK